MDTNSTILTSLGSITRGTANVTTAPHLNTTTNSSAASNILPSTSRVTSTSTLFAAVSATPIPPPAADMAERVTKVAMDSNRLTISPFWVLGLLIVLFMVVSAWYLVVRFMFLGLLRPAFSHLITNTNEGTRNLIQSSYEKLGSSGRMITQVTLVLFFFALEQWLVVDTILEATAGEALKHHPSIDVILRIFAFLCQILCWFMVGELKKPKAAKNSKLRDARQKAEDKTNV